MNRRRLILLSAAAVTVPALSIEQVAAFRDKDCSDFRTQRAAQRFFKKQKRKTGLRDAHGLDADNDGIACESNPR